VVDTFNLYISAADDLQSERDLLSRIVTEIPVTLGWQINFSPLGEKILLEKAIIEANLHMLVLGSDIRAPIGYEWHLSRNLNRKPKLFLKNGIARTPAAVDFQRSLSKFTKWQTFQSLSDLRVAELSYISQFILDRAHYFDLGTNERDQLSDFLEQLDETDTDEIDLSKGVAGENSVILSRDRFIPKDGVLIQPPAESESEESE
jgi:hypothetical protein